VARKRGNREREPTVSRKETRFQLDQFSEADLRTWKRMAGGVNEYHVRLFYHLESLRKLHQSKLHEALQASTPVSITLDRWVRIIDYRYSMEPLSAVGSLFSGGRFNIGRDLNPGQFPPYPALYIAENYQTAYAEKFGMTTSEQRDGLPGHELALRKPTSFSSINISGELNNLFDVGRAANFTKFAAIIRNFKMPKELKMLAREVGIKQPWLVTSTAILKQGLLANDWKAWPAQLQIPANPQILGRLIMDAGFEGVIYPSTKGGGKCVAIFPKNFDGADSYLELADAPPEGANCTRLDSQTWRDLVDS